jgi:ribosome-associated translation inhibitor RaiA
MRIEVLDHDHDFPEQTRAYAEYRIFSSLAHLSDVVTRAHVTLSTADTGRRSVLCTVEINADGLPPARIRARGDHAYDAINRAAGRLSATVRRHTSPREQPA